jgi:hypothetical protein
VKHVRILGIAIVAVLAIAAVAATTASALPEWGKCVAQAGGKYEDSNCTLKAKGKGAIKAFEWEKGATQKNVAFTGHSEGSGGVLSTGALVCEEGKVADTRVTRKKCAEEGGQVTEGEEGAYIAVECENETNAGEQVGKNKVANVHVTFTGCKLFGSAPCTSAGAAEGEVQTSVLKGELGYIGKAAHEVGLKLEPATKHGLFAEFVCSGIETGVGVGSAKEGSFYLPENKGGNDQIISPITPVNQMSSTFTQVYTVDYTKHPENVPNKFEGKNLSALEDHIGSAEFPDTGSMWSPAGEEITNVNTPAEAGEIKG